MIGDQDETIAPFDIFDWRNIFDKEFLPNWQWCILLGYYLHYKGIMFNISNNILYQMPVTPYTAIENLSKLIVKHSIACKMVIFEVSLIPLPFLELICPFSVFKVVLGVSAVDVSIRVHDFGFSLHISIHPCSKDDLAIFQLDHSLAL